MIASLIQNPSHCPFWCFEFNSTLKSHTGRRKRPTWFLKYWDHTRNCTAILNGENFRTSSIISSSIKGCFLSNQFDRMSINSSRAILFEQWTKCFYWNSGFLIQSFNFLIVLQILQIPLSSVLPLFFEFITCYYYASFKTEMWKTFLKQGLSWTPLASGLENCNWFERKNGNSKRPPNAWISSSCKI